MEDIISKLAEIEAAASHIMDDVAEQKKQLAREYEESIQNFDDTIDREVQEKSETIRRELENIFLLISSFFSLSSFSFCIFLHLK